MTNRTVVLGTMATLVAVGYIGVVVVIRRRDAGRVAASR
jgi:hypothetical protein